MPEPEGAVTTEDIEIPVDEETIVSGLLLRPEDARFLYVLAHGAGAGMEHPFMEEIARRLAVRGVASLRYQFPYMEAGRKRPDRQPRLEATVRAAVAAAADAASGLALIAGGKSMGGRMTSNAQAARPLPGVRGIAFLGFPLHQPRQRDTGRSAHLDAVTLPMLFVQGTRDRLADLDQIEPVVRRLGDRATLHVVDGGDHSFNVLKRSGRDREEVMAEVADAVAEWGDRILEEES